MTNNQALGFHICLPALLIIQAREQTEIMFMEAVLTWTLVFSLWKKFTSAWNQTTSRNPLQSSQCFAWFPIVHWETCFWVCFCSSYGISFSSMDRVSVISKLAMKWCLMRMGISWLCPFNPFARNKAGKTIENTINCDCWTGGGYIEFGFYLPRLRDRWSTIQVVVCV